MFAVLLDLKISSDRQDLKLRVLIFFSFRAFHSFLFRLVSVYAFIVLGCFSL